VHENEIQAKKGGENMVKKTGYNKKGNKAQARRVNFLEVHTEHQKQQG
jgi:hypothetical protein